MKALVIGASGGSGLAAVRQLLAAGHEVTAFCRRPAEIGLRSERLHLFRGDVMNAADLDRAMPGHDAVIVTLGIRENPFRVRLAGARHTPLDVRSAGTRNVVAAMQAHGVRRLVVQTSFGVGETRDRLGLADRLFFALLLKPQIADTEEQERVVRESGLDWVLAQPVHLTDGAEDEMPSVSTEGDAAGMKVSRNSIGRFLAAAAQRTTWIGRTVALSAPAPARTV